MARIKFPRGKQTDWLNGIIESNSVTINEIAEVCRVSKRTVRDWRREKNTISKDNLLLLTKRYNAEVLSKIIELPDYWYAIKSSKKGAQRRMELYGPPGTPEGRRKGGINSQLRRREDPEKYKLLGCKIAKVFELGDYTVDLAETVGIILGDGGIVKDQLKVSVSRLVDRPYADFVSDLFQKVFNEKPKKYEIIKDNVIILMISGVGLIHELEKYGLFRGNKIKKQVDFPSWIWNDVKYQKACVRGLIDTDGGCYFHTHTVKGKTYKNFGMSFTSNSKLLLHSVATVLKSLGFKFSLLSNRIYIYNFKEIKKYFEIIGTHNPKNIVKFQYYLNQTSHRVVSV